MRIAATGATGIPFVSEVPDGLEEAGRRILAALADDAPTHPVPERRAREWYVVELRRGADDVQVLEPDYVGGAAQYLPSLRVTSAICAAQERLHDAMSAPRTAIRHEQGIVCQPGVLDDEIVLATRHEPTRDDDSGWRLVRSTTRSPPPSWEALRLYQLVARRAIVVVGLQLPQGWSFKVVGDTLDEVAPPGGNKTRVGIRVVLPG